MHDITILVHVQPYVCLTLAARLYRLDDRLLAAIEEELEERALAADVSNAVDSLFDELSADHPGMLEDDGQRQPDTGSDSGAAQVTSVRASNCDSPEQHSNASSDTSTGSSPRHTASVSARVNVQQDVQPESDVDADDDSHSKSTVNVLAAARQAFVSERQRVAKAERAVARALQPQSQPQHTQQAAVSHSLPGRKPAVPSFRVSAKTEAANEAAHAIAPDSASAASGDSVDGSQHCADLQNGIAADTGGSHTHCAASCQGGHVYGGVSGGADDAPIRLDSSSIAEQQVVCRVPPVADTLAQTADNASNAAADATPHAVARKAGMLPAVPLVEQAPFDGLSAPEAERLSSLDSYSSSNSQVSSPSMEPQLDPCGALVGCN